MEIEHTIAALILAAGFSTRFGSSKQIAYFGSQTLLALTYNTILKSGLDQIFIVIPEKKNIFDAAKCLTNNIIINPTVANRGIGSSIKCGLNHIVHKQLHTKSLLITLCDQPLIQAGDYKNLYETYERSQKICASSYAETLGVPCIIPSSYFGKLLTLDDQTGAKELLYQEAQNTIAVSMPNAQYDIDDKSSMKTYFNLWNQDEKNLYHS